MADKKDITYFVLDPSELWEGSDDVVKRKPLLGREIDNNFHTLEGRDIKDAELTDDNQLVINTYNPEGYISVDLSKFDGGSATHVSVDFTYPNPNQDEGGNVHIGGFVMNQDHDESINLPIYSGQLSFLANGEVLVDGEGNTQFFSANEENDKTIDIGDIIRDIQYSSYILDDSPMHVGDITVTGKPDVDTGETTTVTPINIPNKVSAFSNDAQYIPIDGIDTTPAITGAGYRVAVFTVDGNATNIFIPLFSSTNKNGLVNADPNGADDSKFLSGEGVWKAISAVIGYQNEDFSSYSPLKIGTMSIDGTDTDVSVPTFGGAEQKGVVGSTAEDSGKVLKSDGSWVDVVAGFNVEGGVLSFFKTSEL